MIFVLAFFLFFVGVAFLLRGLVALKRRAGGNRSGDDVVPGSMERVGVLYTPHELPLGAVPLTIVCIGALSFAWSSVFAIWVVAAMVVLYLWYCVARVCLVGGVVECGRCGYQRPEERSGACDVCPECRNRWWLVPRAPEAAERREGGRLGVVPLGHVAKRRWFRCGFYGLIGVTIMCSAFGMWVRSGNARGVLPVPMLRVMLKTSDDLQSRDLIDAILSRPSLTRVQADEMLRLITERAARDEPVLVFSTSRMDSALQGGVFSDDVLDDFFSGIHAWSLEVRYDGEAETATPVLIASMGQAPLGSRPMCVVSGARVDDGPWLQRRDVPDKPGRYATEFEDRSYIDPVRTHIDAERIGENREPFEPIDVGALPDGRHTITVDLHEFVVPVGQLLSSQHSYFAPDGRYLPHPGAIWDRSITMTAVFEIQRATR